MMVLSVISLLLLAAASSTAAESPFAKYTGGVEPVFVAELGKEYTGWTVDFARKYTLMEDIVSDKCGSIDCPDGLAELPGDNLFYFNQDFPRDAYAYFEPQLLERNFTTILSYVRFYTGKSDVVKYYNFWAPNHDDDCYLPLETDQYVDGFPRVCWYETVFAIPLDGEDLFQAYIGLLQHSDTFLVVESFSVGFFDVDVDIAHRCAAYPIEGTCVDNFNGITNSTIYEVENSTIYEADNSTIYDVDNSTIYRGYTIVPHVHNSTIYEVDNSTIYRGHTIVPHVHNSTIYEVDNSTIYEVENSTIYEVENSTIYEVENSTIYDVDNSTIYDVDNSTIYGGHTIVPHVHNSTVYEVDNSTISCTQQHHLRSRQQHHL